MVLRLLGDVLKADRGTFKCVLLKAISATKFWQTFRARCHFEGAKSLSNDFLAWHSVAPVISMRALNESTHVDLLQETEHLVVVVDKEADGVFVGTDRDLPTISLPE